MKTMTDPFISRRDLLRLGSLTAIAATFCPTILVGEARAQNVICNPDRPKTPAGALAELVAGNERWASGDQEHPGEDGERRTCVADPRNPQTPFAALISCSDSRVPPELVFDQGLGDLFVARVAGNIATGRLLESLLYGTGTLGAQAILVLGHSDCGAVSTAVRVFPGRHDLEFVRLIEPAVRSARKIVKKRGGDPNDQKQVIPVATDQNVLFTARALRETFRIPIRQGKLLVAGGRYDLGTQVVTMLT
jgi:carbonic anhydrase